VAVGGDDCAPEVERWLQKFDSCEDSAVLGADEASDAAGELFVVLEICDDQLLRRNDSGGDGEEAAVGADIDGFGAFLKRLVGEAAVEKDVQGSVNTAGAALLDERLGAGAFCFAAGARPSAEERSNAGQYKPELKNMSSWRRPQDLSERPLRKDYAWRRRCATTTKLGGGSLRW
jgi:hypothetical protein